MDKHYYFIVEPSGFEDGPYVLTEIAKKLADGAVSEDASLLRVGETRKTPIRDVAGALAALPPPRDANVLPSAPPTARPAAPTMRDVNAQPIPNVPRVRDARQATNHPRPSVPPAGSDVHAPPRRAPSATPPPPMAPIAQPLALQPYVPPLPP